jgi:glutaredoxin 3
MDKSPQFIVYTNSNIRCPYCVRVKNALTENSYTFVERDIADPVVKQELLTRRPTARSVPQIFLLDGLHIGGHDELISLIKENGLNLLLEMSA